MTSDSTRPVCDIVLPIHNSLSLVRDCIASVLQHTMKGSFHLHLVDDASDSITAAYLQEVANQHECITLHRNAENLGFVKSCNIGIAAGKHPYVLILNSDVIVTEQWLVHIVDAAESDDTIAAVNPLANHAGNIALPMAPGMNYRSMHHYLSQHAPKEPLDVVTCVGFCLLLRRLALEEVGVFDEIFGHGYCEESDLCMRLTTQGWRTVVTPDTYVFHKGSGSFTGRDERYRANRALFDDRWRKEYRQQFKAYRKKNPLKEVRDLLGVPTRWAPKSSLRMTYRAMRKAWKQRDMSRLAKTAVKGIATLPCATVPRVNMEYFARTTIEGKLRVTYILPTLAVAGGVLSVIQLVNELIMLGVEARIIAFDEDPAIRKWKLMAEPIIYRSPAEMLQHFPPSDVVVATHWSTARMAAKAAEIGKAKRAAYFLQDYEAWFYPEENTSMREKVKATYELIEHKIVKSDWLAGMLKEDGYATRKISLGMDLGVFYPRPKEKHDALTIMTMARPSTPWRGWEDTCKALAIVKEAMPEVHIQLFGEDVPLDSLPFAATATGTITDQNTLAKLYAQADLFVDGSTFQGFGRPALEAMACGTACVLTNVGGVNEYARDGYNCLLVPPSSPEKLAEAMLELLREEQKRKRLAQAGIATACDYSHKREAKETLRYFQDIQI